MSPCCVRPVPARPLRARVLCLLSVALWSGVALAVPASAAGQAGQEQVQMQVQVQDGDMASVLAFRLKPRGATIEQMMVALLRSNPDAFIQGNVNLLQGGAVLRLPTAQEVFRTPAEQARELVQGHHQRFLNALDTPVQTTSAPASAPQTPTERQALLERLRSARAHLAEIEQNIRELERLAQASDAAPPASAAAAEASAAPSQTSGAESGIPVSWLWLGAAAIVAMMVGVGASRRPAPSPAPHQRDPAPDDSAAAFQARLSSLSLNLDSAGDEPGRRP